MVHWGCCYLLKLSSQPTVMIKTAGISKMTDNCLDINQLPIEVREKLAELDLELSEGDITQKGYEKKRSRLLAPYLSCQPAQGSASPSTRAKRRVHRRLTRHESRYHSEVRQEAVQQALAAMQNRVKPSLPMPSKRTSLMATTTSPSRENRVTGLTDTSSDEEDEDSLINESSGGGTPDDDLFISVRPTHLISGHNIRQQKSYDQQPKHHYHHQSSTDTSTTSSPAHEPNLPPQPLPPRVIGVQGFRDHQPSSPVEHRSKEKKEIKAPSIVPRESKQSSQRQLQSAFQNQLKAHLKDKVKTPITSSTPQQPPLIPSPASSMQQPSSTTVNNLDDNDQPPLPPPHHRGSGDGTGSGGSSYDDNCSSSERPPEKPPQRISSRSDTNIMSITDMLQSLSTTNTSFSTQNQQSQPDVTKTNNNNDSLSLSRTSPSSQDIGPEYDNVYGHQENTGSPVRTSRSPSIDTYGTGRWKVSAKIQQLLNTLKRPKKRPLHDFYIDDETDLEIAANQLDPSAPRPEGSTMLPSVSEPLIVSSGLPKSLEEALQRYGSATFKAPAITVLDPTGKISPSITYGKLLSRSRKIAYNLLNKIGQKGLTTGAETTTIKPGDRVALVYPNSDPIGFICAFYGCLMAGIVPVPIEVPMSKRDAGSQQIGFLLGSCNVSYALTADACFKGLPKSPGTGEIHTFKGWPPLTWLVPDNWSKPPRDWVPPPRISEEVPAYVEYTLDKDGSMKGVCVSRQAMISHCRALTSACNYTEGDVMVCVLDFKREVGHWHSVLTSVLNGMHVIFIPYSLMKINPSFWMLMITKFKATVAICKSRDLHWGLLATKEHKDVNLSTLRMLLVSRTSP
uniref:DMAP1-binding domain-containing protein n=1 Tax=Tetranychus urticae TaxID=32264 RepID=T1KHY9_TETUR